MKAFIRPQRLTVKVGSEESVLLTPEFGAS